MIIGECPYCDGTIVNGMPDNSPGLGKMKCENCGEEYWLHASRIEECFACRIEDFDKYFRVDNEKKTFDVIKQPDFSNA